jgi:hypothetical protein
MINKHNMADFKLGWIVGNFQPSIIRSEHMEVGLKYFKTGDIEPRHMQIVATEITVVIDGKIRINGTNYEKNDVIVIGPGIPADFESLTSSTLLCIKSPSNPSDKVLV